MKILVVEDDPSIAKLYQVELTAKGHEVETVSDGEAGIAKTKEWKPNLVLLDIMMPKVNGIDALKAIKADAETAKTMVIMLTNFGQENLVKDALNGGAEDYILKYQTTPAEVAEKVEQHLFPGNVELPEN